MVHWLTGALIALRFAQHLRHVGANPEDDSLSGSDGSDRRNNLGTIRIPFDDFVKLHSCFVIDAF